MELLFSFKWDSNWNLRLASETGNWQEGEIMMLFESNDGGSKQRKSRRAHLCQADRLAMNVRPCDLKLDSKLRKRAKD